MRCNSSTVPRTATRSPTCERVVAAGAHLHGLAAEGMIATGARCPKWARKVSCMFSLESTASWTTAKSIPASSMACDGRSRQASTKDGAANDATSSTLPGARDPFQRMGHRRVGQLDHEGEVRSDLLDPQRRLERVDLVDLDADDGGCPRQAGLLESFAPVGVASDMGDTPVVEGPPAPGIGVVVDHDDLGAAEVRTAPRRAARRPGGRRRSHGPACPRGPCDPSTHVVVPDRRGGCCSVKCRCPGPAWARTPLGL